MLLEILITLQLPSRKKSDRYLLVNWLALPQSYGLEVGVLYHSIEAGTSFDVLVGGDLAIAVQIGTEVAMTEDDGLGIVLMELRE